MDCICVYCSSASDVDAIYFDAARQVGRLIAERAGTLVFGGNGLGCMNVLAESTRTGGGKVVGITPRIMHDQGSSYLAADELVVTEDMRQRKAEMERRADAFVALAGGFGTLEELFETLTHRHLASYIGVSRVTATRMMGELRERGAVKGGHAHYRVSAARLRDIEERSVLDAL